VGIPVYLAVGIADRDMPLVAGGQGWHLQRERDGAVSLWDRGETRDQKAGIEERQGLTLVN